MKAFLTHYCLDCFNVKKEQGFPQNIRIYPKTFQIFTKKIKCFPKTFLKKYNRKILKQIRKVLLTYKQKDIFRSLEKQEYIFYQNPQT